jgi:hypothetical protein
MSDEEIKKEAKRRGITEAELRALLGNGAALKTAMTIKGRQKTLNDRIAEAGG